MNTILIVDDTQLNRKMMIDILKRNIEDLIFIEACNGEEGLEVIREKEVNLVILDLNMPVKDGYQVLREVQHDEKFNNLPIIVNSSVTDTEKVKEALSLGAIDFFTKSKKPDEMEVIISTKVLNFLKYYQYVNNLAEMNRMLENDIKIASAIQKDFLKTRKEFNDVEVYIHYEPFKKLSGDLFATAEYKGNKWALLVDMKNSNISSSILSLFFRELFMKNAKLCNKSNELMEVLNKEFIKLVGDNNIDIFFSAIIVLIKDNKIYITNAGNSTQPFIFKSSEYIEIKNSGRMIGVLEDSEYEETEHDFNTDDSLIMFTDGLFSKFDSDNINTIKNNFENIYKKYKSDNFNAMKLTLNIYNEFLDKKNGLKDDLTIVSMKKK